MVSEYMNLGAVLLVGITSLIILIVNDWRYNVIALVIQYVGVFILVDASWPLEMAITKMVAGWVSGAILGIAMLSSQGAWRLTAKSEKFSPTFKVLAAIILVLTISSLVLRSTNWLSVINPLLRWGSFILIGIGILQLSLTSHPLRTTIGLLTALSGFEIIYAAIETSTLVTGLLAGISLGLALVGAYLLVAPTMEVVP